MQSGKLSACVLGLLALAAAGTSLGGDDAHCDADNAGLELPDQFCAQAVARDLGPAGQLALSPAGDIYVAIRDQDDGPGGVVGMRDTDGDGRMDEIIRFGERGGSGIALADGQLYVAEDQRILRMALHDTHLGPNGDAEVIAAGLEKAQDHGPAFASGPDHTLFVQADDSIWRFDSTTPGEQLEESANHALGIRPGAKLAWNPLDDQLYALTRGQHASASSELLRVTEGVDYGWPYCYHDSDAGKRLLAADAGGDGERTGPCNERYPSPELALPGHLEYRDLLFHRTEGFLHEGRSAAFISVEDADQSRIIVLPLDANGRPQGDQAWETFARMDGDTSSRFGGLAEGPDGKLYVSDARQGTIWRIQRRDDQAGPKGGWRLLPLPLPGLS